MVIKMQILKKNSVAVWAGITAGVLTSLCAIFFLSVLFRLNHENYVTILPKSVTAAISIPLAEKLGGYKAITAAITAITGILGNISAEIVLRICHITNPIARGVAVGTSSHAIGTVKAFEFGQVEGATSSLSIVIAGLLTVFGSAVFALVW